MEDLERALQQRAFQRERGLRSHWSKTWATWVASQTPATSSRPSASTSLSVPRIGPAVSTGEAIRTRRRAAPIRLAMRWESSGPRPGQNHGRMVASPSSIVGASKPSRSSTLPRVPHLLEVARVGRRQLGRRHRREHVLGPRPVVERPVGRAGPDRRAVAHRVLVVHQVAPARDRLQRHPELLEQLRLGARGRRLEGPRLLLALVLVEHDADPHPAVARGADGARDVVAHRRPAGARRRGRGRATRGRPPARRRAAPRRPPRAVRHPPGSPLRSDPCGGSVAGCDPGRAARLQVRLVWSENPS